MTHRDDTTNAPDLSAQRATAPGRDAPTTAQLGLRRGNAARDGARARSDDAADAGDDDAGESTDLLIERCGRMSRRIADLERDIHALSHSIRSPLVALKGFAGLLQEELAEGLGDNGRHFLGRISEAGRRIEARLNDLAQLHAATEKPPSRTWIDPAPLVEALAAEFKPTLDETGMRILLSQDLPLVHCEPRLLELALRHLIGNALQHGTPSEPRHVEISIERLESETRVAVKDGGPGMDEALAQRAFEPFDSAGSRIRRFDDGRESSGIGLALVKRIAEAHGGRALLETAPGRGTRVVVTLPHE